MSCRDICKQVPGGYAHSYDCPLHHERVRAVGELAEALRGQTTKRIAELETESRELRAKLEAVKRDRGEVLERLVDLESAVRSRENGFLEFDLANSRKIIESKNAEVARLNRELAGATLSNRHHRELVEELRWRLGEDPK